MTVTPRNLLIAALMALGVASPAAALQAEPPLGSDGAACVTGGPAIRVNVVGLKDRIGELKLELYPATEADFLKDDRDLKKEGKFFRRVRLPTPASGPVSLCIRVPAPGPYALFFSHNRDGKNKFNIWEDGAGMPGNKRIGRAKPTLPMARIVVPEGVVTTDIRAQYLRGLGGFGPLKG